MGWKLIAALLSAVLPLTAPSLATAGDRHRLPPGYHWGRCLLSVDGKTLISGKCGYEMREHSGFYIAGPKQIYEGTDYSNPEHAGASEQSKDYWAVVWKEDDGTWTGYGNEFVNSTHGGPPYQNLTKQGACFVGQTFAGMDPGLGVVRICLWRK